MPSPFRRMLDSSFHDRPLDEVLDASPAALRGVSAADAEALQRAFGIATVRALAEDEHHRHARALLAAAGSPAYDPGPPADWELLFAAAPLQAYVAHPSGRFRTSFGPVFYRGRLDGSARVLVVGQDPSSDETIAGRAFVGMSGQRVQGLLAKLGIERSYLMLNTFLYGVRGQFDAELRAVSREAAIRTHRETLLAAALAENPIEAVLAVGSGARDAVEAWAPAVEVVHVVHPGAPEELIVDSWNAALPRLRALLQPDPGGAADATAYAAPLGAGDQRDIPRADLPFGVPASLGTGGTRSRRLDDETIAWRA